MSSAPAPRSLHPQTTAAPALEGDLSVFPPTDLFQFFALLGLSGTLELTRTGAPEEERVRLTLRGGRLVEADTTGPRPYLGEILVRRYGVSLEAVLDGLERQSVARRHGRPFTRLGQMLLDRRHLSADVLRRALDDAVSRIAGPVLLWETGRFTFLAEPSAMVPATLTAEGSPVAPPPPGAEESPESCAPEVSLEELVLRRWSPGEAAR